MKRKPFAVQDHGLWDDVRRTISPLHRQDSNAASVVQPPAVQDHIHLPQQRKQVAVRTNHSPPPLGSFDRRTAQRLSRGQLEPDTRLDLHGCNLETARQRLYHFLEDARRHGARLALVITGKGTSPFARHTLHGRDTFHSPEREGRLRREVPLWLHENHFRVHVVGYQPAHPRHGGGGAFYIRLRSLRDSTS